MRAPVVDPRPPRLRHVAARTAPWSRFGSALDTTTAGPDQLAAGQPHPARPARSPPTSTPLASTAPCSTRRVGQRERHPAGAAAHVAPAAVGQRAHRVHRVHAGGARVARPGPGADHALAVQQRPQPLVATCSSTTSAIERCSSTSSASGSPANSSASSARSGLSPSQVSRGAGAQRAADPLEQRLVGQVARDVGRRERGDLGARSGRRRTTPPPSVPSGNGHHRLGSSSDHLEPVPGQLQLGDDQRVQQPDHVGARADQVAGVGERALQGGRAAELLAGLQHQHRPAGPGQVGGRGQPVVPAADHHDVPAPGGQLGHRHRQPDPAEHLLQPARRATLPAARRRARPAATRPVGGARGAGTRAWRAGPTRRRMGVVGRGPLGRGRGRGAGAALRRARPHGRAGARRRAGAGRRHPRRRPPGAELAAAVRAVAALPLVVADHPRALRPLLRARPRWRRPGVRAAPLPGGDRGDGGRPAGRVERALPGPRRPRDRRRARRHRASAAGRAPRRPCSTSAAARVALHAPGRGHTDHDVVAHVPDAGDRVRRRPRRAGRPARRRTDSDLAAWPATLDALLALRPARSSSPGTATRSTRRSSPSSARSSPADALATDTVPE